MNHLFPHRAYVGIGSNLGDRAANCLKAIERLNQADGIRVLRHSSWFETEPHTLNGETAPWYLNGAVALETRLTPIDLQLSLHRIEKEFGRERTDSWAPRPLDLDLLFFDDLILKEGPLQLPHPQIPNRKFVLIPLAQIAPHLQHPTLGKTIVELLQECADLAVVRPCQTTNR